MARKYGETLKKIRQNMCLTQRKLSEGIMSQSNYSKVEQGNLSITFECMIKIISRLDMTVDEFLWIHTNGDIQQSNLARLLRIGNNRIQRDKLRQNIINYSSKTKKDEEILLIIDGITMLEKNQWDHARKMVLPIWERLKEHDALYYKDLIMLNFILYIFPVETAYNMSELVFKKINNLGNFNNVNKLMSNIEMNLILMLIKEKYYQAASDKIEQIIPNLIDNKYFLLLATAYVRKGYLSKILGKTHDENYIEKGLEILRVTYQHDRIKLLQQECETYLGSIT